MRTIIYFLIYFTQLTTTSTAIFKNSIPNDNFQTGQIATFINALDSNSSLFTISYATAFYNYSMQAGIGIIGSSFTM